MQRPEGGWRPDGRAQTIRAHAEAGAEALGRPADLFLIHAPDPRVDWDTSVRALAKVGADGVAQPVGLSNVTLRQLDEALDLAPVKAVQLAWNALDDAGVRSGVVARCLEKKLQLIAHSPLGGPKNKDRLLRSAPLVSVAARHGVSPAVVALAALLDLDPSVVVIPGARRPDAIRDAVKAAKLVLTEADRAELRTLPGLRPVAASKARAAPTAEGEVVLLMGLQGSGKSTLAKEWIAKGYVNLNRDLIGKDLKGVARLADEKLKAGERKLVLDNTYVTRTARSEILDVAAKHGVAARGIWIDVPLHEANVNVIWRQLDAHGRLLSAEELKRGPRADRPQAQRGGEGGAIGADDNTYLPPLALMRMVKQLEVPTTAEGFTSLESRPFVRVHRAGSPGRFVAAGAKAPSSDVPTLVFDQCAHRDGPPSCWCRMPLPGLLMEFAHQQKLDLRQCELIGSTEVHQVMAAMLGARFTPG
jgi:diketogulonate reductase-like aldo/keto reductase/predicted kinase